MIKKQDGSIAPHGGKLVNCELKGPRRASALRSARKMKSLRLSELELADLEMIANGALSPLRGFMNRKEFNSVLRRMRLPNGIAWSVPVLKQVSRKEREGLKKGDKVALVDDKDRILAIQSVNDIFSHPKQSHVLKVYGTKDKDHPGVANVYAMGDFLIGGEIKLLNRPYHKNFSKYRMTPLETRAYFRNKNWNTIVAFQTRNPIHRAHEYIQKCSLEIVDGLLTHPLVGKTQKGDIPASVRMRCYEVLIKNYFPKDRVLLSVFPAHMRYAGPREAIFHAIARKNYGCTHFIVGRDHAGASRPDGKPYYGAFDAQRIFSKFKPEEIGITPLFFGFAFFCKKCEDMVSPKTCPHKDSDHIFLSGTKVREMLKQGKLPPREFTYPEVARILMEAYKG